MNKPLTAAERKQRQRQREKRLNMKPFQMDLAAGERRAIAATAHARGFECQTEYLLSLMWADREKLPKRDMSRS